MNVCPISFRRECERRGSGEGIAYSSTTNLQIYPFIISLQTTAAGMISPPGGIDFLPEVITRSRERKHARGYFDDESLQQLDEGSQVIDRMSPSESR